MKILTILILTIFLINEYSLFGQAGNDVLSLKGKQFYLGSNKFYPLVCNYKFTIAHSGGGQNPSASYYYISPYGSYGVDDKMDCNSQSTCFQKILDDFAKIRSLGFNSIRTGALYPGYNFPNHVSGGFTEYLPSKTPDDFGIWANRNDPLIDGDWAGQSLVFSPDITVFDANRNIYFTMLTNVLQAAYQNSLLVLLDVQEGDILDIGPNSHYNDYLKWLQTFSNYIINLTPELHNTVAAYVVLEEPHNSGTTGINKKIVCERTRDMYDLIKGIDANHLITIGGGEPFFLDLWDQGVMKLDFVCPHLYPDYYLVSNQVQEPNSDNAVERVLSTIYWLKNYSPYPWMIGETGFGAQDDYNDNGTNLVLKYPSHGGNNSLYPEEVIGINGLIIGAQNGEVYNQRNFADSVLKMTRDCNGSGFSIWQYQENASAFGNLDTYGILRIGDLSNPNINKPVCDAFIGYLNSSGDPPEIDPDGGQMPLFYYDPYHIGNINGIVSGVVKDFDTDEKIKGARILGSIQLISQLSGKYFNNATYTHEEKGHEGEFNIVPYDWFLQTLSSFSDIFINSVGASNKRFNGGVLPIDHICRISRESYNNRNYVHDIDLMSNQSGNYSGFANLRVNNYITESQSTADFIAERELSLLGESWLKQGSEVVLHIDQTFPACDDFTNYRISNNQNVKSTSENNKLENNIVLKFITNKNIMLVNPNPNNGIFQINFSKNEIEFDKIIIYDLMGKTIYQVKINSTVNTIDLSNINKGAYIIKGQSEKDTQTVKLIIN